MSGWVLVTGAAQRIGREIALELASAGWDIVVHYNKSEDEANKTAKKVRALKRKVFLASCDFANKRQLETFVPSLVEDIGPFTALVNNASLFQSDAHAPGGGNHKLVNLEAPLLLSEAFHKQLPDGETGAIVNLLDGCLPEMGFSSYSESKKSLRVMTIELARRMAPKVRVNGVAPGPVLQAEKQTDSHFARLVDSTLLKRNIDPKSVALTVRFLIENPSITGEILHIDGGIRLKNTPSMMRALAS